MIIGLGNDLCNISRIEKTYDLFGMNFIQKCFGKAEQAELIKFADNKEKMTASLAKRFAAKESFVKALGCGFKYGIMWKEIELLHTDEGKPILKVSGKAAEFLKKKANKTCLWVSLSDDYPWAQSVVIIEAF